MRQFNTSGKVSTAFMFGQSKAAPIKITSIPQLELCGTVLAVQAVNKILKEIDMKINEVTFFTNSKVVPGYIRNKSRPFYVYIANRVELIRRYSGTNQ